jgi:hypothetical protein
MKSWMDDIPPSVKCRWGQDCMTFVLVSVAGAPIGAFYVVEASWAVRIQPPTSPAYAATHTEYLQIHAAHGKEALEKCVRSLARVVGRLDTTWDL